MKKINKFFLGVASLMLMTACSDDLGIETGNQPDSNDPGAAEASVFLGVNFQCPGMGQSRSYTDGDNSSNDKTEVGSDIENNVNEVLVVLAAAEKNEAKGIEQYGFIAASTVQKNSIYKHVEGTHGNAGAYHAQAKISKQDLASYYEESGDRNVLGDVAVFLFVNPSGNIVGKIASANAGDVDWLDTTGDVKVTGTQTEGAIWSTTNGGSFLMTNAYIAIRKLPAKFADWNKYTSETNVFNLSEDNSDINNSSTAEGNNTSTGSRGGAVKVERAAARMDFRDGSPTNTPANTYHVVFEKDENGANDEDKPLIDITLGKMALVNMNNKFYYLRRTSNNGLNTLTTDNGGAICGLEKPWYTDANGSIAGTPGNYVVDAWAEKKQTPPTNGFSTYFNYPFFEDDGSINNANVQAGNDRWYTSNISDVLNGNVDNWSGSADNRYHVWRYLTENVTPQSTNTLTPYNNQVNGISTGVVFKGKMKANDNLLVKDEDLEALKSKNDGSYETALARNALINAINNEAGHTTSASTDPILYSFAGSLYATWTNVFNDAISQSFSWEYNADKTDIIVAWNRETSIYKAIFGGGLTGYTFKYIVNGEEKTYQDKDDTENEGLDPTSPNYLWNVWNADGRKDLDFKEPLENQPLYKFKVAATTNEITIYQSSVDITEGWGYYCYYYYWNRHNDNGNNALRGPMEQAVVRNNVYKLSVTNISKLGHPRIFLNDPDSPTPDTPDEKEDVYFTVDTEVLPWVVRVNNIEF